MTKQNPFSEFILAGRLLSTRRCHAFAAAAFVLGASICPGLAAQSADNDPVLKMDVPKMDQLPARKTLKGGVFHHEALIPKAAKLQSSTSSNSARLQDRDGKLGSGGTPKRGILNMFKAKAAKDKVAPPLKHSSADWRRHHRSQIRFGSWAATDYQSSFPGHSSPQRRAARQRHHHRCGWRTDFRSDQGRGLRHDCWVARYSCHGIRHAQR